ncbi:aminoglycoside phosphotransferase family protein [Nocardioides cavernae]|uniref:Aminoglycoside phosphotransferase family protein n=1 Tax=Nocardioides cavernae TaxID=1921566 RepID=A0ABR8N683_9ACTN|nr:aminoglycoside phosphotransferase family protein [Nocardioides cavernae]MBD3923653.1 aminoglycoside phosphotransferase family protein [Nocardioides cavernae]MBM7511416.1 hypothetical protein [Nocardioides cavernae]
MTTEDQQVPARARTHHVALVHDGAVWSADGALPTFVHADEDDGDPTRTATRHVADGVHAAPPVRLPKPDEDVRADILHVLALRDDPDRVTGGTWLPIGDLPEPFGAKVGTALAQHTGTAPRQRPDWFRAGWYDRVEAWIDDLLTVRGRRRTGPVRTHRVWSISAVLEVPTSDGVLWFKACCDHFRAEAAILHRLSERLPDLVPIVVAADEAEGWLLMEPLAGASDRAAGAPQALAPVWAAAQLASLDWLDALRASGCPDRGLEPTLAAWRRVLADDPEMALLADDERVAVLGAADEVEAQVREFWATGLPDTLAHGDLHLGNVAYDGQALRLFDWTDACISHPFLDGSHLAYFVASDTAGEDTDQLVGAFAEPWREAYPDADVDRALALAPLADLVFQTVTFAGIAAATEEGAGDFTGVVAQLVRSSARRVGALPADT